jgi:hypothetical protein
MRLIERHQISYETFGVVGWNNFPAFTRCFVASQMENIGRLLPPDAAFLIEKFVGRHIRIEVQAARRIEMLVMPGGRVGRG